MNKLIFLFLLGFLVFFTLRTEAQDALFDVINYDAEIEPDIANKSVKGRVLVSFVVMKNGLREVTLNAGRLEIDSVQEGQKALHFKKKRSLLKIEFLVPAKMGEKHKVEIKYHGTPGFGIRFFPEKNQVYTVFSTSQWMPCVDSPDDRATFRLKLNLWRNDLVTVGNGRLINKDDSQKKETDTFTWEEKTPVSTYLFGFAIGDFREIKETHGKITFRYLASPQFSETEIKKIFNSTTDMLDFYQSKAGVKYTSDTYTQVLAKGNAQQEMSGFTALNEDYGRRVLEDKKAIWLGSHEFAHQWWGNMVTNRDWTHFWLNEGITNFMTAAYLEHRFGHTEYDSVIKRYQLSYDKVREAGKDKSLVFPDWNKPTSDDRRLVYNKGAYVIHLLRKELGEELFWKGIKEYTQANWGKSVTTKDFKKSMEEASERNLSEFFNKWIYLKTK